MKYMGSKRAMLTNGLGSIIAAEIKSAERFVDLFSGSGAVAVHVAENYEIPVIAYDLQKYSAVLSGAVIRRSAPITNWRDHWDRWFLRARGSVAKSRVPIKLPQSARALNSQRAWCGDKRSPICRAYGGYYFSPLQAVWIDALLKTLPEHPSVRTVARAAVIRAASRCIAAPGHTAQPHTPNDGCFDVLHDSWSKSIVTSTLDAFDLTAPRHALTSGRSSVADANKVASYLREGDLVFIDPPYSGVHYSRFYHVLETIAVGRCGPVSGAGRYPATRLRPQSQYSMKSTSEEALRKLLGVIANRGARAIITFPEGQCSNGLSGSTVTRLARESFEIRRKTISTRFSSLGGNGTSGQGAAGRAARVPAKEMILVLTP